MKKKPLRIVLLALMMPLAIFGQGTPTLNGGKSDCNPITITAANSFVQVFDYADDYWYDSNNLPECWNYFNTESDSYYPTVLLQWDDQTHGEISALFFEVTNNGGEEERDYCIAILPEMTNVSQVQMNFTAKGDEFAVGVMEDGNFVQVKAFEGFDDVTDYCAYFDRYTGNGTQIAIKMVAPQEEYNRAVLAIYDIEVSLLPTCFIPDDLEAVGATENTISLQWMPHGDETAWQLQYANTEGGWNTVNVAASDLVQGVYQLQGLSASMTYQVRLRAACGGNDYSDWTQTIKVNTDCGLITGDSYLVNFDDIVSEPWQFEEHHLPSCWQWLNESTHEYNGLFPTVFTTDKNDSQYQSPYSLLRFHINGTEYDGEETVYDQYAILPKIANLGTKQMKFSARAGEWGNTVVFEVGVITDPADASTFTPIRTMQTEGIVYRDFALYFEGNTSGYIAIKLSAVQGGYAELYIEDIAIIEAPDCKMLFDCAIVENSITDNSVTLDWTPNGNESQWQIQYRTDREDWTIVIAEEHPFTLSGLDGNTRYHVRLRSRCGEDQYGEWSDMLSFNTDCPEYQPIPYYEGFETWTGDELDAHGDMLPCWSKLSTYTDDYGGTGPYVFLFGGHTGEGELTFQMRPSNACQMAILPAIQNLKDMQISFYAKGLEGSYYVGYFYSDFEVGVMTDPTDASTYQFIQSIHPNDANYTKYTIPFNTYTGNGNYIVFRMVGNPSLESRAYIDDIVVSEIVNYTNVFTCGNDEGGYWNDPSYWSAGTLPTMDDNVTIKGKAIIPSDYVAEANIVEFGENGSLHVENNGQLKHNNIGVEATFAKTIEGYGTSVKGGYHLIASPMVGSLDAKTNQYFGEGDVLGLLDGEYDLYRFSQSYDNEWRNYKKDLFTIDMKTGYLYANRDGVTLTFSGTLQPSGTDVEVPLENEHTAELEGFNLIGNPFPCDAYLAGNMGYYRINENGDGLIEASGVIAPCEGIFVQASGTGQSVSFTRTQSRSDGSVAFSLSKKQSERGTASKPTAIDRARIRFGEGRNLGKLPLMASSSQLYIPQNGKDYAMVYNEGVGELPLNFKASEYGTYTIAISIEEADMRYLHLIDNLTGSDVDLLATEPVEVATYTFTASPMDYASRFKVVFATGNGNENNAAFAYYNGSEWVITASNKATVQLVDVMGRVLLHTDVARNVTTKGIAPGVYVMRLIDGNDVKTQKIVVE